MQWNATAEKRRAMCHGALETDTKYCGGGKGVWIGHNLCKSILISGKDYRYEFIPEMLNSSSNFETSSRITV